MTNDVTIHHQLHKFIGLYLYRFIASIKATIKNRIFPKYGQSFDKCGRSHLDLMLFLGLYFFKCGQPVDHI